MTKSSPRRLNQTGCYAEEREHIYSKGGHGFGMRKDKHPVNDWPQRCSEWMKSMGWLEGTHD